MTEARFEGVIWRSLGAGALLGALLCSPVMAADATSAANSTVTFAKDIAPIFQEKCQDCHRAGTAAPMSLITYQEARPWAKAIRQRVIQRQMPPWHIDKTVGIQKFENDMSLSDEQIDKIVKWVDSGAPLGNPKDMPPPKVFPDLNSWQLSKVFGREPDLVIDAPAYVMAAHHQDVWWKPVNTLPIDQPRWVRAVEIRPTTLAARKVTHHAVATLQSGDDPGAAANDDDAVNPGGILMEWAIGKSYDIYRENSGKLIKPTDQIVWDIHLHASGEQVNDQVQLGIYLYPKDQTPKYKTVLTNFGAVPRGSRSLDIPPNSIAVTQAFHVLKQAARIENFQPHMHLRGKAMEMEAILPDGTTQVLSYVDHFNFNWMTNYIYTDDSAPVLPKGTIIHITAWHDNTRANPNNPDPDQWVGQGDRTVDEMAHAWVNVTYISDQDYKEWAAKHKVSGPMARSGQGAGAPVANQ